MATSVARLETELPIQSAAVLMHCPPGMVRSQKKGIGEHWKMAMRVLVRYQHMTTVAMTQTVILKRGSLLKRR